MENSLEKKRFGRKAKIVIASVAVLLLAGASVYAVSAAGEISETEAKQIALAQVSGADQSHITKCVQDMDDGRKEYDVEIIYGGYEYDFEISAKDGTIFDQSKERVEAAPAAAQQSGSQPSDAQQSGGQSPESQQAGGQWSENAGAAVIVTPEPPSAPSSATTDIGLEQAKSIALGQVAGASSAHITAAFSDYDDGRLEYDVEIRYNGYEYDFEIDGATGQILSKDVDGMDYDDYYDYD